MLDPDGLNVWYNNQLVGFIWRDALGLSHPQYMRTKD